MQSQKPHVSLLPTILSLIFSILGLTVLIGLLFGILFLIVGLLLVVREKKKYKLMQAKVPKLLNAIIVFDSLMLLLTVWILYGTRNMIGFWI